jgi:hypothetical protein
MERNTDWKLPAALILAGLALFVALSGRGSTSSMPFPSSGQGMGAPGTGQTIIVQNNQPPGVTGNSSSGGSIPAVPAPAAPSIQPGVPGAVAPHFGFGYGFGHGGSIFRFLVFALLLFLIFRFFRRRRWGSYPGGWGPGPWRGQPGQPGQGTTQASQPGQGQGHWEWHPDNGPAPQAPPAPPNQAANHGDIMHPGEGNQE